MLQQIAQKIDRDIANIQESIKMCDKLKNWEKKFIAYEFPEEQLQELKQVETINAPDSRIETVSINQGQEEAIKQEEAQYESPEDAELKRLRQQNLQLIKERDDLQLKLLDKETEIQKRSKDLKNYKHEAATELQKTMSQKEETVHELIQQQQKHRVAQQQLELIKDRLRVAENKADELRGDLRNEQSNCEKLKSEIRAKDFRIEDLSVSYTKLETRLVSDIHRLQDQLQAKSKQLYELKYRVEETNNQTHEQGYETEILKQSYLKLQSLQLIKVVELNSFNSKYERLLLDRRDEMSQIESLAQRMQNWFTDAPQLPPMTPIDQVRERVSLVGYKLNLFREHCQKHKLPAEMLVGLKDKESSDGKTDKPQQRIHMSKTSSAESQRLGDKLGTDKSTNKARLSIVEEHDKASKKEVSLANKVRRASSHIDFSLENNPDSQPILNYQQLQGKLRRLEDRCKQLYVENQKLSDYIVLLQHPAQKKTGQEQAIRPQKSVLDKLQERLDQLPKVKPEDSTTQIKSIIGQLRSYINLTKIEPMNHPIRAKHSLKTNQTGMLKEEFKKTYSQGGGRSSQHHIIDAFDIYPDYREIQLPQIQEGKTPAQTRQKKEINEFERYFEQHRDIFSEISSVRNQSMQSQPSSTFHNYFARNDSTLDKLVKLQLSEDELRAEAEEEDKLSEFSMQKIKMLYHKLREKHNELLRYAQGIERKFQKKILDIETDHRRKIAKMTKQFNESFKLMCERSGLHLIHRKSSINSLKSNRSNQESPKKMMENETEAGLVEELRATVEGKSEEIKELERTVTALKEKATVANREREQLGAAMAERARQNGQRAAEKTREDFEEFIRVVISSNNSTPKKKELQRTPSNKAFKKIPELVGGGEVLQAQKVEERGAVSRSGLLQLLAPLEVNEEQWQIASLSELKDLFVSALEGYRCRVYTQLTKMAENELRELLIEDKDSCWQRMTQVHKLVIEWKEQSGEVGQLLGQWLIRLKEGQFLKEKEFQRIKQENQRCKQKIQAHDQKMSKAERENEHLKQEILRYKRPQRKTKMMYMDD